MELTPLSAGLAGAAAVFALQLLLCFKSKRTAIRLIPVYLVVATLLYAGATFLGVFGTYSAGAISGNELAGLVLLLVAGISAAGSALAWLIFGISKLISRKKREELATDAEGAAHKQVSPIVKKAALAVAAAIIAVGAAVYLNPELQARAFVALHGDELESSIEAGHGVPAWLGNYDYNSFAREHSMLQITLTARGSTYYGCYYSFDDVPLPFQNADVSLVQDGHEYWEWQAEGDNHGSTERITENWFYFEASF